MERFKAANRKVACNIYIFPLSILCFATILDCCLPFTWANCVTVGSRLGQMLIKFKTGKFCPGIVFAICTNQLHLPKNGRERLKLVSKTGFEETEHEFRFGIFRPGKQDYHFRSSVAPGSFTPKRPEQSCSIYFLTGFSGNFL